MRHVYKYQRKYNVNEKGRERKRRWKLSNPDKVKAINNNKSANQRRKKWALANLDKVRSFTRNRRAKRVANGGTITAAEWSSVLEKYGNKCLYPGCERTDVTMDHVVPLFLGGTHTIDNVQPLCGSHNSSKKIKIVDYREERITS